ncbi:MAG: hypothetical protein WC444_06675 [Candidatus Paceibacterota bacterium]
MTEKECPDCQGSGYEECPTCGAEDMLTCEACDGTGVIEVEDKCPDCGADTEEEVESRRDAMPDEGDE